MKNFGVSLALLCVSFSSVAFADLTGCSTDSVTGDITCNLYEESSAYPLTWTTLAGAGVPGYVVLMDSGDPGTGFPGSSLDQQNQSLWSDVLWFQGNVLGGAGSTEVSLIFDQALFPSYTTVASAGFFILENQTGPTVWEPNGDNSVVFNIYSAPPVAVPEPSYLFLTAGLIGVGAMVQGSRRRSPRV